MSKTFPPMGTNQTVKALLDKDKAKQELMTRLQVNRICPTPVSLPRYLTTACYPVGATMPRCWPWLTKKYINVILWAAALCRLLGLGCLRLRQWLEDRAVNAMVAEATNQRDSKKQEPKQNSLD